MIEYWPWWLGALALFTTSIGFVLAVGRPLGVSGSIATLLDPDERRADSADAAAMQAEMEAATREAFGDDAVAAAAASTTEERGVARKLSYWTSLVFITGIVAGGAAAAATRGQLFASLDPTYVAFFGDGLASYAVVFVGAILVGFGTQLGGGCTSGHGLVGCARLQPGSLLSTCVFFGTGIATSFVLAGVLR